MTDENRPLSRDELAELLSAEERKVRASHLVEVMQKNNLQKMTLDLEGFSGKKISLYDSPERTSVNEKTLSILAIRTDNFGSLLNIMTELNSNERVTSRWEEYRNKDG